VSKSDKHTGNIEKKRKNRELFPGGKILGTGLRGLQVGFGIRMTKAENQKNSGNKGEDFLVVSAISKSGF